MTKLRKKKEIKKNRKEKEESLGYIE